MALDQIFCDQNASGSQSAVAILGDAIGAVHFIALVACRVRCVVRWAGFSSKLTRGNVVDPGDRQKQNVRRFDEEMRHFDFGCVDLLGQQSMEDRFKIVVVGLVVRV